MKTHLLFLFAALVALVTSTFAQSSNDNFANAQVLAGNSGTVTGTNVGATGETGEPTHVTSTGTASSVWYVWTPTVSGTAQIDTIGSPIDTVMAVYTGTTLTTLTQLVADDNSGGGVGASKALPIHEGKDLLVRAEIARRS